MPIPPSAVAVAQQQQTQAAHSGSPQVRLIAGPGTGKSSAIEERVRWLIEQGVEPEAIFAVSFTRASTSDLRTRIRSYCAKKGLNANEVRVSTLHSLALKLLRTAGFLEGAYPVDPLVLDAWEIDQIFDPELRVRTNINDKDRRGEIRRFFDAYWNTNQWSPLNYIPPVPPITAAEQAQFAAFHTPFTQLYACVLPGEIVRLCVQHISAGELDPIELLGVKSLIVDEFQDLNPMDLEFVDAFISGGVQTFVAGDDDQSIYSFRYALPIGLQGFHTKYPSSSTHSLMGCFRCTPMIVAASDVLIGSNAIPGRITKTLSSLYAGSTPPVTGLLHRWVFGSGKGEAKAIAESCRDLVNAGVPAREVLILLGDMRALGPEIQKALEAVEVPYETPREEGFPDTDAGRLVSALMRIVCETNDYIAHRTVLGLQKGVGEKTCHDIGQAVVVSNLNYRSLFYDPLPPSVFTAKQTTALQKARDICAVIVTWGPDDTVGNRTAELGNILTSSIAASAAALWQDYGGALPTEMTLKELRNFLAADTDEMQEEVLKAVYDRLGLDVPETGLLPQRIRIMTMHGAKGLSARVVFIPGLEQSVLPGPRRQPYVGLVLEAARLLYVSITRARAACVVSRAKTRFVNGNLKMQAPSKFASQMDGPFLARTTGLAPHEVQAVLDQCALLG